MRIFGLSDEMSPRTKKTNFPSRCTKSARLYLEIYIFGLSDEMPSCRLTRIFTLDVHKVQVFNSKCTFLSFF